MKKSLIVLLLCAIVPFGAFALDFYVGGNAYYSSLLRPADVEALDKDGLTIADFSFAGEARLTSGLFWASAVGMYTPGDANLPHRLALVLDGGIGLQIAIFRAGIGIGPNVGVAFGDGTFDWTQTGANLRATADVVLGPVLVGLNWINQVEFTRGSIEDAFANPYGQLGLTVLFKLI